MTRPTHLFVFALAWTLLAGSTLRADLITWDYSWSMTPGSGIVKADPPRDGKGRVIFTLENPGTSVNTSDISAANLSTVSRSLVTDPDKFLNGGYYTLTLTITDEASGKSGSVTFAGKITGTLSASTANLDNAFIGATTKTLDLGGNQFVVTIGPYTPPGPPSSENDGSIGAHVAVSGISIEDAPEPSTLVLACIGAVGLGVAARRRRHLTRV